MVEFCLTIDLDRDVNIPVPGQIAAGSLDRGDGTGARFISTAIGLRAYADLLDELGMPATFYCEAETLEKVHDLSGYLDGFDIGVHGLQHEDFSRLDSGRSSEIITQAISIVRDITGVRPRSFRAPFMKKPDFLDIILVECGFITDSSTYSSSGVCSIVGDRLAEVPVTVESTSDGRSRSAYLWPLHEGRRTPDSYADMADCLQERSVFVIADHSWHIAESRCGGIRDRVGIESSKQCVRSVINTLLERGHKPTTLTDVGARFI